MDSNLAKCFICDASCVAKCTNQGLYIAQTLTMPLISVLTKCLRTFVEVENEYFCCECVGKIAEYDKLAKLSLEIEAHLYRQYQNKPFRSSFLDDEYIGDQNEIRDKISDFFNFKQNVKGTNSCAKTTTVVDEIDLTTSPSEAAADDDEHETEQESNETVDVVANEALEFINQIEQNEEINQSDSSDNEYEELSENSEMNMKKNGNDGQSEGATEKNVQSPNQQTNTVKKCRTKRGRKRKIETKNNNNNSNNSNNNIQSSDPMRFACHVCGKTYKSKGALGTHMVKHSDNNPHGNAPQFPILNLIIIVQFIPQSACTICKKVFTQRLGLLRHIPIHTGEQQHQVNITRTQSDNFDFNSVIYSSVTSAVSASFTQHRTTCTRKCILMNVPKSVTFAMLNFVRVHT